MKTRLYIIAFLTFIWIGFTNKLNFSPIMIGIVFSTLISFLVFKKNLHFKINMINLFLLIFYIIYELICSSLEVAWDILRPSHRNDPVITQLKLSCQSAMQISLLSSLISLTPGTLVIDISDDNRTIFIHIMFGTKKEKIIQFIKEKLEPKVMEAIEHV